MKVPNTTAYSLREYLSLSRLQNEGSQPQASASPRLLKSIKATE